MKKLLITIMSFFLLVGTRAFPVTWYDHCYNLNCPDGQTVIKKQAKMMGSKPGTHQCYDTKTGKHTDVIKEINYKQCHTKPCNLLEPCKGYNLGKQQCPAAKESKSKNIEPNLADIF
jgi:hypothetical protein